MRTFIAAIQGVYLRWNTTDRIPEVVAAAVRQSGRAEGVGIGQDNRLSERAGVNQNRRWHARRAWLHMARRA